MRRMLFVLISVLSLGAWQGTEAAAGGGGTGKGDLKTNIHVIDSSSPPIVVGEVIGFNTVSVFVALSPTLVNADPPLVVAINVCYPLNSPCVPLRGTTELYYTDAACTSAPYFLVPEGVFTPTSVFVTSTGVTTSYQIYQPGTGPSTNLPFSAYRNIATNNGACEAYDLTFSAVPADATAYAITLTPPFKMKNR